MGRDRRAEFWCARKLEVEDYVGVETEERISGRLGCDVDTEIVMLLTGHVEACWQGLVSL